MISISDALYCRSSGPDIDAVQLENKIHDLVKKKRAKRGLSALLKDERLPIPLPPLPEQNQSAEFLAEFEAEGNKKNALESLFKTLLSLLMTGKIRVKDLEI